MPEVGGDTVSLARQYYSNLAGISPIRQGFSPGTKAKMEKATTTLTISKTSGHDYIGEPNFEWSDLEQMQIDMAESQSFVSTIAIFVFEKGQEIDPDTDLEFTGTVDVDSFGWNNGALNLTITDEIWKYNTPLLQYALATNGELIPNYDYAAPPFDGGYVYSSEPEPIMVGVWERDYTKYRFVKLTKRLMEQNPPGSSKGHLLMCRPGTGGATIATGDKDENWVYHYQGSELKTVHRTTSTFGGEVADNAAGTIALYLDATTIVWGKDWPVGGGTPFDLQGFQVTHSYFMLMHDCTGSAASISAPISATQPGDIWYEILNKHRGIGSDLIGDNFILVNSLMPLYLLRHIQYDQIDFFDLLDSFAGATGLINVFVGGKFQLIQGPLWGDRTVDYTIYPKDIVKVAGKSSLKITADPGKSRLAKDQTLSIKYDSDMGFTPTDAEQDGVRKIGNPLPNPPGFVNSLPAIDSTYFEEYPTPRSIDLEADEITNNDWIYTETAAWYLYEALIDYRQNGANGNLLGGEVTINKRLVNGAAKLGDIIQIKDANIDGNVVINAQVYNTSTDLNKMTTKLKFQAVGLA